MPPLLEVQYGIRGYDIGRANIQSKYEASDVRIRVPEVASKEDQHNYRHSEPRPESIGKVLQQNNRDGETQSDPFNREAEGCGHPEDCQKHARGEQRDNRRPQDVAYSAVACDIQAKYDEERSDEYELYSIRPQ